MLSCCQRKGLEYCFQCEEFPCKKYDGVDTSDSFITHKNQFRDMEKAQKVGVEAYGAELNNKVEILQNLLKHYDDGRRKSFYCVAVNLLELADVNAVIAQIEREVDKQAPLKEKATAVARLLQAMADKKGIVLQLRK